MAKRPLTKLVKPNPAMSVPKVVHLITLLEMGGAQGNTIYTVEHLSPTDFEVHLWAGRGAYWDDSVQQKSLRLGGVRFFSMLVRPLNPLFDVLVVFQLASALKKMKPQILHTHSSKAGIVGRLAAKLAGVSIVIHTFHGFGFNDQQRPWTRAFFIWLEKKIAPLATKLVFVSKSNQQEAQSLGIGRPEQYVLIRSGVPLQQIADSAAATDRQHVRASLGIAPSAQLVTTIGAFKPQKNLVDFVRMASLVARENAETVFLMIGDGAQRPRLQSLIAQLGLTGRVFMPGWRQDVASLLSVSDVFVLTSLWEGLPRALLEALQIGVPSLCYATDGVRDLFTNGDPQMVDRKNWQEMGRRVLKLLSDSGARKESILKGREKITADFDIDVMVGQQRRLYLDLLTLEK